MQFLAREYCSGYSGRKCKDEMKSKLKILEAERTDLPEVVELWQELMNFHKDLDSF